MTDAVFSILARLSTDAGRKRCITRWYEWELIPATRAEYLIHLFNLAEA